MKADLLNQFQSGQKTAKAAAAILISKKVGYVIPSAQERQNLLVAFAKKGKVVYGKAFDVVKLAKQINLSDVTEVEQNLEQVTVFEIKSTRKKGRPDFGGFFFGLTGAEILVAQSLKNQFGFVFVNTVTKEHVELKLSEIFSRAKGIYPTWSISF